VAGITWWTDERRRAAADLVAAGATCAAAAAEITRRYGRQVSADAVRYACKLVGVQGRRGRPRKNQQDPAEPERSGDDADNRNQD